MINGHVTGIFYLLRFSLILALMFATIGRITTEAVASCSHRPTRYLHGRGGLRPMNWRTPKAYPTPIPLMSNDGVNSKSPVDLTEEEEPHIPRKPVTKLSDTDRELPEEWRRHRLAIKAAYPSGWQPPKKISREAMDGLRLLHRQNPEIFTTPVLADKFRISAEAVRRILRSKWEPTRERKIQLAEREKREMQERISAERVLEAQRNVDALKDKWAANEEHSQLYWSKHGGADGRRRAEKKARAQALRAWDQRQRQLASRSGARSSDERPQRSERRPKTSRPDRFSFA